MENKYKVLFVDDSKDLALKVKQLLVNLPNIKSIDSTSKITVAKTIIETYKIDMVILDMRYSGNKGAELLKWIQNYNPYISVIMFSGNLDQSINTVSGKHKAGIVADNLIKFKKLPAILSTFSKN